MNSNKFKIDFHEVVKASVVLILVFLAIRCTGISHKHEKASAGLTSDSGMVVSAHPLSSKIGVDILKKGGNAIDAAVATAFGLAVCYPEAGNIGGGGFMLVRTAEGATEVFDFREKAPLRASRDMYLDKSGNVSEGLSTDSHLASGVPGSVDGLITAQKKYGKLSLAGVIQPAIDLAEKGFSISEEQAASLNSNRNNFIERNSGVTAFAGDNKWKEGDILVQKDLAATLRRISDNGREGFYSGMTARLIMKEMQRGKGIITEQDLNEYKTVIRAPLTTDYRGYKIITIPPPSGGGIILIQLLEMIEKYSIKEMGFHSAAMVHLIAEAEKRSFADRAEYAGDPSFVNIPVNILTDSIYLVARMANFNPDHATPSAEIKAGNIQAYESKETTHFSVVDSKGNAVALTTTLNGSFGNSIVVDSAGFLMNNEMDDFSVKPGFTNMYGLTGGEANSISPGKRMLSSMTPVIVEKEGKLFLVAGSPGGSTIPTTVFQVIVNVIDYGMDIKQAVDAGRFHHQWLPDRIYYEKESLDTVKLLDISNLGHVPEPVRSIGQVNAILINADGRKTGGADRRGYNMSCGY